MSQDRIFNPKFYIFKLTRLLNPLHSFIQRIHLINEFLLFNLLINHLVNEFYDYWNDNVAYMQKDSINFFIQAYVEIKIARNISK